jgi:hypothetical protein
MTLLTLVDVWPDTAQSDLTLASLRVISTSELQLRYSMPVDESALATAPYQLRPLGVISSVERLDPNTVLLHLGTDPPLAALGNTYSLTVTGMQAVDGTPITTGTGNTLSFVLTQPDLNNVFVYPHPVHIGSDGFVTFANLTTQAEVEVLDQRFKTVRVIKETDGNGGVQWDLRDDQGVIVPPGMYFYRVRGSDPADGESESGLRKLMIRR